MNPNRNPFYAAFCHNGNPVPPWQSDPGWFARIEKEAEPYQRLIFHMLPGHDAGVYGANVYSVLTPEAFTDTCGIMYRRWEADKLTGFYVGARIQKPGVRSTLGTTYPVNASSVRTWDWLSREIAPFKRTGCVWEMELWVDALPGPEVVELDRLIGGHGYKVCGEAWPLTPEGLIDLRYATRNAYWITPEFFDVLDGRRWKKADGPTEDAYEHGPGGRLGSVDPATTELHIVFNDWHYLIKKTDGGPLGGANPWRLPPVQIADEVRGLQCRGFIVSGSSTMPEVQAAILAVAA